MTFKRTCAIVAFVLVSVTRAWADDETETGTLLALQGGYVFLASGEAYRAEPALRIADAKSGAILEQMPMMGAFVALHFDGNQRVVAIDVSSVPLPPHRPSQVIQSILAPPAFTSLSNPGTGFGLVAVTFTVRVPASTARDDQVYLTSGERGWDPLAIRMDRVDALHFRATISVAQGSSYRYLYSRGNSPTIERGANGLQRRPRSLLLDSPTPQTVDDAVEHWGDEVGVNLLPAPQATPTPYNPAPFPNVPMVAPAAGRRR